MVWVASKIGGHFYPHIMSLEHCLQIIHVACSLVLGTIYFYRKENGFNSGFLISGMVRIWRVHAVFGGVNWPFAALFTNIVILVRNSWLNDEWSASSYFGYHLRAPAAAAATTTAISTAATTWVPPRNLSNLSDRQRAERRERFFFAAIAGDWLKLLTYLLSKYLQYKISSSYSKLVGSARFDGAVAHGTACCHSRGKFPLVQDAALGNPNQLSSDPSLIAFYGWTSLTCSFSRLRNRFGYSSSSWKEFLKA